MDKDNRVGSDCGSWGVGWAGQERAVEERWDNCNRTTIKKLKKNKCLGCTWLQSKSNKASIYRCYNHERLKIDYLN